MSCGFPAGFTVGSHSFPVGFPRAEGSVHDTMCTGMTHLMLPCDLLIASSLPEVQVMADLQGLLYLIQSSMMSPVFPHLVSCWLTISGPFLDIYNNGKNEGLKFKVLMYLLSDLVEDLPLGHLYNEL